MAFITMGVISMRPCSQNRYPLAPIQMTKVFVVNPHPLELFHEGPQTVIDGGERLGMTLAKGFSVGSRVEGDVHAMPTAVLIR